MAVKTIYFLEDNAIKYSTIDAQIASDRVRNGSAFYRKEDLVNMLNAPPPPNKSKPLDKKMIIGGGIVIAAIALYFLTKKSKRR